MALLTNLRQQRPTPDEFEALVDELKTDGPRGAAVTAGALVDDMLRNLLEDRMVTLTQEEKNNLFSSFGPLSSFGQGSLLLMHSAFLESEPVTIYVYSRRSATHLPM